MALTAEELRLADHRTRKANWREWGPYLSERAWGTVREDYSANGDAWNYVPHDHARSRAFRWGEDGIAGISDRNQRFCFALTLWNGHDPILKERMFGLTNGEGNHGEDVKECYFYLDNTPTHSYMKMLYKYPQKAYPYADLVNENERRGFHDPEYELLDTGVFAEDRYFDVIIEYAKAGERDIVVQITTINRGPDAADCALLPTLWFRNTWSWGYPAGPMSDTPTRPSLSVTGRDENMVSITAVHPVETYTLYAQGSPHLLFTENETNHQRLFNTPNPTPYVKDAFHRFLIDGDQNAINPANVGTKVAMLYRHTFAPGESHTIYLRLSEAPQAAPFDDVPHIFQTRIAEADAFYASWQNDKASVEEKTIQRQALAGMLWSKQLYYYDIEQWLAGDPAMPAPPVSRLAGRNNKWTHLSNFDVISMPDNWEYPWYATWDLAFHCVSLALIDADFAKRQLELLTREWYLHPNGQLPAYEWAFDDVNPPVHAWAAWRVYKIDAKQQGKADREFLEGIYHKLLLNFTWWVNRKDIMGNNIFQGGFLGLDNIGVFDRSTALPFGGHIDQSDGTSWMGAFCLTMMKIALELAKEDPVYEDTATKFFEHFLRIAHAMCVMGQNEVNLWDDADGFFYDVLHLADERTIPLKVHSLVGILPMFAVDTLEPELMKTMEVFERRMHWFLDNRSELAGNMASVDIPGQGERRLFAILTRDRLIRVLQRMLDPNEFLSDYGIRSVSLYHREHPYHVELEGETHVVSYQPAESDSRLFGGNSNWRGPIWFPVNYMIIESLQKFHHYYGDELKVECPTGSGVMMTLDEVATELSRRMIRLFLRNDEGKRPIYGAVDVLQNDPNWRDLILFHEYFNGDNGAGLGASHQTGWTGLIAKLIQQSGGELNVEDEEQEEQQK